MSQSPTEQGRSDQAQDYFQSLVHFGKLILRGGSFSGREKHCTFLNTRGERFANVSAVSGLDFDDDGRGVALVDWDHDGDLDLWISNRTGPQLRLLRNDAPRDGRFLAVRLRGVSANRDGIGARLTLYLKSEPDRPMMRSIRAGEGFLAQSSKWAHFGLGDTGEIDRLVVQWPGGDEQVWRGLDADAWYVLTQDDPEAQRWTPPQRTGALQPRKLEQPKDTAVGRVLLLARAPLPVLAYRDFDGQSRSLADLAGQPVLVNLWATWCAPCVEELKDLTEQAQAVGDSGVHVLALSVDGHGDDRSSPAAAAAFIGKINFPYEAGAALPRTVEQLEIVRDRLFDWRLPLPLPTSFLIDGEGRLAAIYYGPVDVAQLLRDVETLDLSPRQLQAVAPPLPGRWLTPPRRVTVDAISQGLAEFGHYDEAAQVLERFADAGRADELAMAHLTQARSLAEAGRLDDAVPHYRKALELQPNNPTLLLHAGIHFGRLGRIADAAALFERLVAVAPDNAEAHYNLGLALARLERIDTARARFAQAVALDPAHTGARMNHAMALEVLGRRAAAWDIYRDAAQAQPTNLASLAAMARLMPELAAVTQTQRDQLVALAERANELTGGERAEVLDVLAQAYAAAGRLDRAVVAAERAVQQARAAGALDLAQRLEQRLADYRAAGGSP